jgi:hypothetical protein
MSVINPLCGWLNSAFRNGINRVIVKTSNTAATRLQAIVPAMRHQWGLRKPRSLR